MRIKSAAKRMTLALSLLTPSYIVAQSISDGQIAVNSLIQPVGSQGLLTVSCGTSAALAETQQGPPTSSSYRAVSTVCTLSSNDGSDDSKSLNQPTCTGASSLAFLSLAELGSPNTPTASCTWTVKSKPGVKYTLLSKHYLWMYSGSETAVPGSAICAPIDLWDPQQWLATFSMPADDMNVTPQEKYYIKSHPASTSNSTLPVGCISRSSTIPRLEAYTGAIQVATTHATLTTMSISPSQASFFQSQSLDFLSNQNDLTSNVVLGPDDQDAVQWTLKTVGTSCLMSCAVQGTINGSGASDVTYGRSGLFLAPEIINGTTQGFSVDPITHQRVPDIGASFFQQLCAQEKLLPTNSTCVSMNLFPLFIYVDPSSEPNQPLSMELGQEYAFIAAVNTGGVAYSPAKEIADDFENRFKGFTWDTHTVGTGAPEQISGEPNPKFSKAYGVEEIYDYTSSAFQQSSSLSVSASVDVGHIINLPDVSIQLTTKPDLQSQTISFPAIAPSTPGSTVSLIATASSNLPVSFYSMTLSVCAVSSNYASMIADGTCTIAASQKGDSTYALAKSAQSFQVTGQYQGPPLGSLLIASIPEEINPFTYQYDEGDVTITVNGKQKAVHYSQFSTPAAIASSLAAYFSKDTSSPVVAKAVGAVVNFYPRNATTGQITITTSVVPNPQSFPHPAFTAQVQ